MPGPVSKSVKSLCTSYVSVKGLYSFHAAMCSPLATNLIYIRLGHRNAPSTMSANLIQTMGVVRTKNVAGPAPDRDFRIGRKSSLKRKELIISQTGLAAVLRRRPLQSRHEGTCTDNFNSWHLGSNVGPCLRMNNDANRIVSATSKTSPLANNAPIVMANYR